MGRQITIPATMKEAFASTTCQTIPIGSPSSACLASIRIVYPINSLARPGFAMFGIPNILTDRGGNDWEMAISFPVKLGRRLSELREKHGLSQTQLADMAGIGRAHLSQIENGAVAARIDTLYALTQALGLKLEELFKGF
jgi:DNA-binding XRE family transcriptional regulator